MSQCESTIKIEGKTVRCMREAGHKGLHYAKTDVDYWSDGHATMYHALRIKWKDESRLRPTDKAPAFPW